MPRRRQRSRGRKRKQAAKVVAVNNEDEVWEENDDGTCGNFCVERIMEKRFHNGRDEYLIKWKNYPHSSNTWEPIEHLECNKILNGFKKEECRIKLRDRLVEMERRFYRVIRTILNSDEFKDQYPTLIIKGKEQIFVNRKKKVCLNRLDELKDCTPDLEAVEIISIERTFPTKYFLVKFKYREYPMFVSSEVLYHRWPLLATKFYLELVKKNYQ